MYKKKKSNKFEKSEELRQSMPDMKKENLIKDIYGEDPLHPEESIKDKINNRLLGYKFIRTFCVKINVEPFYIVLILTIPLILLSIKYSDLITTLIAILYPLLMTFKTLQYQVGQRINGKIYKEEDEDQNTNRWLSYWLLYAFINNVECLFGSLIKQLPLAGFIKLVFLICCFLPQIQLSVVIYQYVTSQIFSLYGQYLENFAINLIKRITGNNKSNDQENESSNKYETTNGDLIDDDFSKRKKAE